MQPYLIHIVGAQRTHDLTIVVASDFAAIRRAEFLAHPGERLEVWRGESCIFELGEGIQRYG